MKRFVQGEARSQMSLLPECLDDFVPEDNPVRVVEAFIDATHTQEAREAGVCWCCSASDRPSGLSPFSDVEDLPVRLPQPGAFQSAIRTRMPTQRRTDVADWKTGPRL